MLVFEVSWLNCTQSLEKILTTLVMADKGFFQ